MPKAQRTPEYIFAYIEDRKWVWKAFNCSLVCTLLYWLTLTNSRFFTFYLISHENFEMKIRIPCIRSRVSEKKNKQTKYYVIFLRGEKWIQIVTLPPIYKSFSGSHSFYWMLSDQSLCKTLVSKMLWFWNQRH